MKERIDSISHSFYNKNNNRIHTIGGFSMTLEQLEEQIPKLKNYTKNMPADIRSRCIVRKHPAGTLIHQKDMELDYFGIVAIGSDRVVNEFENGNVYMIESNESIDFIGEVTILAKMPRTSVTIEAVEECLVAYISRKDAEYWLSIDHNILSLVAEKVAYKLYRSSYHNGLKLFYPPSYLLLDYLVKYANFYSINQTSTITIAKTRQMLQEEIGVNVKTLNRTITQLKEDGFFTLCKGKITFNYSQYQKALEYLESEKS